MYRCKYTYTKSSIKNSKLDDLLWKCPRSTELPRPFIKPSPIQRLQVHHAIATAANNDRGIDAPTQPPSHPILAPIITTRNLRIRQNQHDCLLFFSKGMCCRAGRGVGWRTNQPSQCFPARSVIRLLKRILSVRQSGHGIQSNTFQPSIKLFRPWYFPNKVADHMIMWDAWTPIHFVYDGCMSCYHCVSSFYHYVPLSRL